MKSFGLTDKGKVRKDNQDCFIIEKCPSKSCLIVGLCDGMGGAKAGGIASQLANKAPRPTASPSSIPASTRLSTAWGRPWSAA